MSIIGERIRLRLIDERTDLEDLRSWFASQEFLGDYLPVRNFWSSEHLAEYLGQRWRSEKLTVYIVERNDTQAKIGFAFYFSVNNRTTDIGCVIGPDERGKGSGKEALKLLVDQLFNTLPNVQSTKTETVVDNAAAVKILQQLGFADEGKWPESIIVKGMPTYQRLYRLTRQKWEKWHSPLDITKQ